MDFFAPKPVHSQGEKLLRPLLLDEGVQVLSTFDLNQVASLTYGEMVGDDIFELMEKIFSKPLEYTPLTIQKTLVVLHHVLIYGSEKCVNSGYGLGRFVDQLVNFNTILLAQQQQGAKGFLQRLQGGGVDKGGPVRQVATEVQKLLADINQLQRIRHEKASQDSLVPVGDDKVAFVTDEVRHYILKKKIEEHRRIVIKSNLAKSDGGFGGGYNARDGKNVVGAAHGIEEMIKIANRQKKKFSDEADNTVSMEDKIIQDLAAEMAAAKKEEAKRAKARAAAAATAPDLLGVGGIGQPAAPIGDLLDFGAPSTTPATNLAKPIDVFGGYDLLGTAGSPAPAPAPVPPSIDMLGLATSQPSSDLMGLAPSGQPHAPTSSMHGDSLLSLSSPSVPPTSQPTAVMDPFAPVAATAPQSHTSEPTLAMNSILDLQQPPSQQPPPSSSSSAALQMNSTISTDPMGGMATMMTSITLENQKQSVMGSNEDRFAALDALASTSTSQYSSRVTELDRKNAENRLLGFASTPSTSLTPSAGTGSLSHSSSQDIPSMTPMQQSMSTGGLAPAPSGAPPVPPSAPPPPPPATATVVNLDGGGGGGMIAPGAGTVATQYGRTSGHVGTGVGGDHDDGDDDNPWVMGGTAGSGWQLSAAPAAPPPPPPPSAATAGGTEYDGMIPLGFAPPPGAPPPPPP